MANEMFRLPIRVFELDLIKRRWVPGRNINPHLATMARAFERQP